MELRREAAKLYLDAFDRKLGPVLGRDERAVGYLAQTLQLTKAIAAIDADGELLFAAEVKQGCVVADTQERVRAACAQAQTVFIDK